MQTALILKVPITQLAFFDFFWSARVEMSDLYLLRVHLDMYSYSSERLSDGCVGAGRKAQSIKSLNKYSMNLPVKLTTLHKALQDKYLECKIKLQQYITGSKCSITGNNPVFKTNKVVA